MKELLKDNDIVKALECCINSEGCDCENCPYNNNDDCQHRSGEDLLALIHRLQDDYSNLKERYVKVLDLNEKVIAEQKDEIETLTKVINSSKRKTKVLDLQREIERLAEQHLKLMDEHDEYGNLAVKRLIEIEELKAKNAELQKQVDELTANLLQERDMAEMLWDKAERIEQQAVKKTADKFSENAVQMLWEEYGYKVDKKYFEKIANEITEKGVQNGN